jgi:hypothetical protein
MDRKAFK